MAEAEINGLRDEIERLQHQLRLVSVSSASADVDFDHSPLPLVPFTSKSDSDSANGANYSGTTNQSWSLSFGLWDYLFSSAVEIDSEKSSKIILRV